MNKKMFRNMLHKKVTPALLVLLASVSLNILPSHKNIQASASHISSNYKISKHNSAHHARRVLKVLINRSRRNHRNKRHIIRTNLKRRYSHHYKKPIRHRVYKLSTKRYHKARIKTASHIPVLRNKHLTQKQVRHQRMIGAKRVRHIRQHANNIDKGLTRADKRARAEIIFLESRGEWNASNGKCYGRFQLLPQYLGWTHGHLNLNHRHQVEVANAYVANRYGSWRNALKFHLEYGYY